MSAAADHFYNFAYWRENFPQVRLNPADNEHVPARSLRVPWRGPGAPPIVAVEFMPQELGRAGKPASLDWLGLASAAVGVFVPGLGALGRLALSAGKAGLNVAHGIALKEWAESFQSSPDDFSPSYTPRAFLVPMPLDRAQIMVSRPWYAPAMVFQFSIELQTDSLRSTAAAYSALLAVMLPPGVADPPAYGGGEAPLFSFVNPLQSGAEKSEVRSQKSEIPPANASIPLTSDLRPLTSGGASPDAALPFLAVGGLLLLGAPVLLVAAVGVALLAGKNERSITLRA